MYICYQWTCTANNKKYVGVTKNTLNVRWQRHCYDADNGSQCLFHKAIRKYGKDAFNGVILATTKSEKEVLSLENKYIEENGTLADKHGYNLTTGGEYPKLSKELRNYLSEKAKQRKPVSNKTKRKLSKSLKGNTNKKGKLLSQKTKDKISEKLKGTKQPEYVKIKRRGQNHYNAKKVMVDGTIYATILEASEKLSIPYGTVYNRIKSLNTKFGSYHLIEGCV